MVISENITAIVEQFEILNEQVHGKKLVYFDNAATSQKPNRVINKITEYYQHTNSNIHRGVHYLSEKATSEYEEARIKVAKHIGASGNEIVFTRGTTESINLVAQTLGRQLLKAGDEVLITALEHHSNIVPWQMICDEKGATLKAVNINELGELDLQDFDEKLSDQTKIVAFNHASNSLGTINPAKELTQKAKAKGAYVIIDGAQSMPHMKVDVKEIGCDFYAGSGHKMYAPTGIGFLFGKSELLESIPPYQGGGEMISEVFLDHSTYNDVPHKFEAGTPNIGGAIALGESIDFLNETGLDFIHDHELGLLEHCTNEISQIDGLQIIGQAKNKVSVVSFVVDGVHPLDLGTMLNAEGIAVRTGQHCTQPVMDYFCIPGTVRASFAIYNTQEEIDYFIDKMKSTISLLRP